MLTKEPPIQAIALPKTEELDISFFSSQKTTPAGWTRQAGIVQKGENEWLISDAKLAQTILRSTEAKQAGFEADTFERNSQAINPPVLLAHGDVHRIQRGKIARFFTPATVKKAYRPLMEELADKLAANIKANKETNLSEVTMEMAVAIAAEVVGLTNSSLHGMARRINLFTHKPNIPTWLGPLYEKAYTATMHMHMGRFFVFDVRPAIAARRKKRTDDVISHLIDEDYSDVEILTECITYGAAGMVTTREYLCVALWHLFENEELRDIMLSDDVKARHKLLHEMLRLEPVVSQLSRRLMNAIDLETSEGTVTLPKDALVHIDVYAANSDSETVGEEGQSICPQRYVNKMTEPVLSFGEGAHRCPGAFFAIEESDVFIRAILQIDGIRMLREPKAKWNEVTQGYEFVEFMIGTA